MQEPRRRRSERVGLILLLVLACSALVGWGGVAAWQAYTENDSNAVTAGRLQHKNTVGATCTSVTTLPVSGCDAIFSVGNTSPNSADPITSGSVKVVSTGTLNSTFTLSTVTAGTTTVAAPSGALCPDLVLQISDANGGGPVYSGPMSAAISALALNNNAASPGLTWSGGGAAPGGSGATGNTFTFRVFKGPSFQANSADQGTSCTANIQFTQTSA